MREKNIYIYKNECHERFVLHIKKKKKKIKKKNECMERIKKRGLN
jgi:hypothetical protein